jgi:beta-lactamase regulating signal transducer with metallopeptidase domain
VDDGCPRLKPKPLYAVAVRGFMMAWPVGSIAILLVWAVRWRRVAAAVRNAAGDFERAGAEDPPRSGGERAPIRLVSSDQAVEPGVFGIVRPVLMWPAGIEDRLSDEQIEAILAHEVAHVRRRDNLARAPPHAGRSGVLVPPAGVVDRRAPRGRARSAPATRTSCVSAPSRTSYAESILKTCQFYVESAARVRRGRHRVRSQEASGADHE